MAVKELIQKNKREVKDVFYLVALQGLNYLAPIIVLPYLMVVLGAEKFGYIGFSLAVCQYLMILVDFGFNLSATKRIALAQNNSEELNRIFSGTFYAKMLLLLLSFVLMLLLSLIPQFEVYRKVMLVMFLLVVGNAFLFIFLFQGLGQIKWVSIVNCIAKLSILPLTFVFVKQADDFLIAALLQGLVAIVAAAISLLIVAKKHWVQLQPFSWNCCKQELHESYPLFLSNAASSIYTAAFVVILGVFALPDEVGRYSATDRIMRALSYGVLAPVLQAFYSKTSTLSTSNSQEAFKLAKTLLYLTMGAMGLIAAAMVVFAPYAENLLGNGYQGTTPLFYIMAPIPLLMGIGGVCGQLMLLAIGKNLYKKQFEYIYLKAALLALVSIVLLASQWQAVGTAVSVLLTEAFVAICMVWQANKLKKEAML